MLEREALITGTLMTGAKEEICKVKGSDGGV
jgi:hypothetical protein